MPVLQQLDEARADTLLRENRDVQMAVQGYPHGVASMNALPSGETMPGKRRAERIFSIGSVGMTQSGFGESRREVTQRQEKIVGEAKENPRQALSDAMQLPVGYGPESTYSPRASTLTSVARIAATKDASVSKSALGEIRKLAASVPLSEQGEILSEVPEIYLGLRDDTQARESLQELVKVATKLYERDSDPGDPNQAFKAMWPSTNVWRRCVAAAAKVDANLPEEIIQNIPDLDIRAFERITFANSLLGMDVTSLSVIEKHKDGVRVTSTGH
jgi:hypothetical protein